MTRPCSTLPPHPTHAQIVAHYIATQRPGLHAELGHFVRPQPFSGLVRLAASATDARGKRLSHQYRLPRTTIPAAQPRLFAALADLRGSRTFGDLIGHVQSALRGLRGAGTLYVYDTALRIGYARGVLPAHVYLHAGARAGARRLLAGRLPRFVPLTAFPPAFHKLAPHEMENLLCRYRECL